MNNLTSNQVCIKLLREISSGAALHLQRHHHLTPLQVEMCLSLLRENALIEQDEFAGYKITQNGIHFLKAYDKFIKVLSDRNWNKELIVS
jgi:predicted transcriptional regulator